MEFKRIKLPFDEWSLEPIISVQCVNLHYDKHHAAYEKAFNKAIVGTPVENYSSLEQIFLDIDKFDGELKEQIKKNGGGLWNHNFYWNQFIVGERELNEKEQTLREMVIEQFGSIEEFKDKFISEALSLFGSGWIWIVNDGGKLEIVTTQNQENPLMEGKMDVLMGIDLWEHAYYLDYANVRKKYMSKILQLTFVRD